MKKDLEEVHAANDHEMIEEAYTTQQHPDWYYPRLTGTIEANTPHQMSDLFVSYMVEQDARAKKQGRGGWKWPGQISEHIAGNKTHPLNGTNLFQSTLMIEHKIFHHNVGMAKICGQQISANSGPNISAAPLTVGGGPAGMKVQGVGPMGVGIGFPRV